MKITTYLACCLPLVSTITLAEVTETEEFTFDLQDGGRFSLSNVNGDIAVSGVEGKQVHVIATKKAGTQKYLDGIEIEVHASESDIRIETHHPSSSGSWFTRGEDSGGGVSYEVTVPTGAQLDTIESVNGSIKIDGVTARIKADTVNGDIKIDNVAGDLDMHTVNGGMRAQFDAVGEGQRITADAVNGRIVLQFPANASARIHAETLNGGIDADDFDLKPDKGFVGRDLDGQIGAGDARVSLDTVNGSITIKRSN